MVQILHNLSGTAGIGYSLFDSSQRRSFETSLCYSIKNLLFNLKGEISNEHTENAYTA